MASLTIRNLAEPVKAKLRIRAAEHGRSMEEEARQILAEKLMSRAGAVSQNVAGGGNLAEAIRRLVAPIGGIDLPEIKREMDRDPPDFS